MMQCYYLLFRASIASLRLVLLFPMRFTYWVFSSLCLCLANVFYIKLLFYCYWPLLVEKLFITILYCFYLFSVFWPTKVDFILFTDFSVIVKCFLPDNFTEFIILLLKLYASVFVKIIFYHDTIVLFWKSSSCYVVSYWASSSPPPPPNFWTLSD